MEILSLPFGLGVLSAVTVALANFFVKRGGDVLAARMVMSMSMGLAVLPVAFFVPVPDMDIVPSILGAVAVHWLYQFAMIRALHRGDLSLVFPVMRGLAPLMTAILASFLLSEFLSPLAFAGLFIACGALLVFAMPTKIGVTARSLDRHALFWAVITAFGIGAYSVVDAHVARQMPHTATFIVWLFLLDWIGITFVTLLARRGRLVQAIRPQIKGGLIGGMVGAISYGAAIWAFTLSDTATVTALRETSVIFAAILGTVFLGEGFGRRRIIASAILALGLLVMQTN